MSKESGDPSELIPWFSHDSPSVCPHTHYLKFKSTIVAPLS